MNSRWSRLAVAALGAALFAPIASGCTTDAASTPTAAGASTAATSATPTPRPDDTASPTSQKDAVDTAEKAMAAFVQRSRPYAEWWAGLSPFLGPDGIYAFEYTDPRNVPATQVTGVGVVSAAPSGTSMTVLVPTDVGQYQVQLNRRVEDGVDPGPWLVDDITPPGAVG